MHNIWFGFDLRKNPLLCTYIYLLDKLQPDEYFPEFIKMLKDVLDGGMELAKYEEKMRELFGIHAYICFTMNKVVTNAVRQVG